MERTSTYYRIVDVRPLQRARKEPFQAIMAAVQALRDGEGLLLLNTFEPVPLYRVMDRLGFDHRTEDDGEGTWYVWFDRRAG
ncbi:MAG TPA: DUF2249 domain-containing protein [Dehalococcoidia bacterium]